MGVDASESTVEASTVDASTTVSSTVDASTTVSSTVDASSDDIFLGVNDLSVDTFLSKFRRVNALEVGLKTSPGMLPMTPVSLL